MAQSTDDSEYKLAGRLTYFRINLDTLLNNVRLLKAQCAEHTKVIAVIKANAYGHGSGPVGRHLEKNGIENFAVATGGEGKELRLGGIKKDIQVLGNTSVYEIPTCYEYDLIPTAASRAFLVDWLNYWKANQHGDKINGANVSGTNGTHGVSGLSSIDATNGHRPEKIGRVVIKVDSGLSRNGCQVEDLPTLVQFCENNDIPIHSIMTHFAQSWDDAEFTQTQMDVFLKAVQPYRQRGIKVHAANSGAIVNQVGVDLDYIRPGISIYGVSPDTTEWNINLTKKIGLKPALCWVARPSLVKDLKKGRLVGYDHTYICETDERIASFSLGYADGYSRLMFGEGIITTKNGINCPVVGRVSMDCITVKLTEDAMDTQEFIIMKDDFDSPNSCVAISQATRTIPYEVCTSLSTRVPRVYAADGEVFV